MLRSANELRGYVIEATDGASGKVEEFLFEDSSWAVRYLVVHTGSWLSNRQVLLSPAFLGPIDASSQLFSVKLTREQIRRSPDINADLPLSRQQELAYNRYYGLPNYWAGPMLWGAAMIPEAMAWGGPFSAAQSALEPGLTSTEQALSGNPHLRSTHSVTGYHIHALDGVIGHVDDFVLNDQSWSIQYIVVDTRNWWVGKKVLLSPLWIRSIDWADAQVHVDMARESIRQAPLYSPGCLQNRDYEAKLLSPQSGRLGGTTGGEDPKGGAGGSGAAA